MDSMCADKPVPLWETCKLLSFTVHKICENVYVCVY